VRRTSDLRRHAVGRGAARRRHRGLRHAHQCRLQDLRPNASQPRAALRASAAALTPPGMARRCYPGADNETTPMRWIAVTLFAGALIPASVTAEPEKNEAWCIRTGEGVLNCEYKTRSDCQFALELMTFPGWSCVANLRACEFRPR